jgi:hypothetical protein
MRHSWEVTKDRYGIPDLLFGAVPDEFYDLVGRVVHVSALVEQRVLELVCSLDKEHVQARHAGKPGSVLIGIADKALDQRPALKVEGNALLKRTSDALMQRHAIVHSLWPNARTDSAWGWRPATLKQRAGDDWVVITDTNVPTMGELLLALVKLVEDLDQFRWSVDAAWRSTQAF